MVINFCVENQRLFCVSDTYSVERSQHYILCNFAFSSDWDGLTKAALFLDSSADSPTAVYIDDDGNCNVPSQITCGSGNFSVSVIGTTADNIENISSPELVITSSICHMSMLPTIHSDNIIDDEDAENTFAKFLQKIKAIEKSVKDTAESMGKDFDNKFVAKVSGKDLSTNDFTDEEKEKLTNLPTKTELNSDLEGKQDKLTFDTAPTANSTNPVMSGAIKTALDGINSKIGDVSHLNSQNVVSAIEELQQYHRQTIEGSELSNMCFNNPMGTYINRIFVLSSASAENKLAANDAIIGVGMDLDNEFTDFVEYENGTFGIYGHVFLKIASALQIGDLTTLQTTEKNNIVGAVNELKTQINALHGFGADFWTGFFKTGRTDFSYAFINNGAAEIKPTQAINATVIKYMLLNCSGLVDASPIVINLSADNPVAVGVCMGCLKMTTPPVINFTSENAHVCRSYVSAYANCAKLTQCTIWFGDGTQSASGERTDMANTFLNCSALTNLTFSGSGSPKSLDLSACKLLSNESIQSLYNALMDVSAVTSGTYKITINSDIQTKITALSLDFAGKGWTLEVKQEETSNA